MFRRIVVPIDLEEQSSWHKALPVAVDYSRHTGAELHVMTVVPDDMLRMTIVAQIIPEGYEQKLMDDAQGRLARLTEENVPDDLIVRPVCAEFAVQEVAQSIAVDQRFRMPCIPRSNQHIAPDVRPPAGKAVTCQQTVHQPLPFVRRVV